MIVENVIEGWDEQDGEKTIDVRVCSDPEGNSEIVILRVGKENVKVSADEILAAVANATRTGE